MHSVPRTCTPALLALGAVVAAIVPLSCGVNDRTRARGSKGTIKYTLDGARTDWADDKQVTADLGGQGLGASGDDYDVKEVLLDSDQEYLYVFLTCNPTVQQHARVSNSCGTIACLYIDSDSNPSTGARSPDNSGNSGMLGTELAVLVQVTSWQSVYLNVLRTHGLYSTYSLWRWQDSSGSFYSKALRVEEGDRNSLIADGSQGVELALPLQELGLRPGEAFDFLAIEWSHNRPDKVFRHRVEVGK